MPSETPENGAPVHQEPLHDLKSGIEAIISDDLLREPAAHSERMTLLVATISEALRRRGMVATLVGGGAVEFYAPEVYVTYDIDLVVESASGVLDRGRLDVAFSDLGFTRQGRHWVRDDVYVEVPGSYLEDPFEQHQVGPFMMRVVRPEVVLVGRLVEFDQTGHTGHGAQAALLLQAIGDSWDDALLRDLLSRERCGNVFGAIKRIVDSGQPVSDALLRDTWDQLRGRTPRLHADQADEED